MYIQINFEVIIKLIVVYTKNNQIESKIRMLKKEGHHILQNHIINFNKSSFSNLKSNLLMVYYDLQGILNNNLTFFYFFIVCYNLNISLSKYLTLHLFRLTIIFLRKKNIFILFLRIIYLY